MMQKGLFRDVSQNSPFVSKNHIYEEPANTANTD